MSFQLRVTPAEPLLWRRGHPNPPYNPISNRWLGGPYSTIVPISSSRVTMDNVVRLELPHHGAAAHLNRCPGLPCFTRASPLPPLRLPCPCHPLLEIPHRQASSAACAVHPEPYLLTTFGPIVWPSLRTTARDRQYATAHHLCGCLSTPPSLLHAFIGPPSPMT